MSVRAEYGRRVPPATGGGVIASVADGSPASRAGLAEGDIVVMAAGAPLHDVIDWQWHADEAEVDIVVQRRGSAADTVSLVRDSGESWGVTFTETVFDGVKTCRNHCAFCFMTQLPTGMRRALYLRDDDYRLSFLQGNFVSLTNLSDGDVDRIIEQQLSPLYVSLHSADSAVREQLVCAREDRALERIDELLAAGIEFHVQIVLVPDVNDGPQLDATLAWLAEREGVASVGIVPLGFTAHQVKFAKGYEGRQDARVVVAQVEEWQTAFRERDGIDFVYLADEFYLNAGCDVPDAERYDGFPQYENGIGLVRDWLDGLGRVAYELGELGPSISTPVTLVTGALFAPVLRRSLEADLSGRIDVLAVENAFFGGNVSVSGLLCGADLVAEIGTLSAETTVLIPDIVANADGLLLDGMACADLPRLTGRDVRLVSCDAAGLLAGLQDVAAHPHQHKE
ncbi:MAG: DUF512 domain-containing protein [Coriobacteriia bacterium]|nr:DUF512 domain-containing protein [Coriobacteriia bacterium]